MIKVAIVDNDPYVCQLLRGRLGREDDLEYVGAAGDADSAIKLVHETEPDLIVLDFMLARNTDPIDLAASIVSESPRSQVVICTSLSDYAPFDGETELMLKVRASRHGVTDWINKGAGIDELIIRLQAAGRRRPAPVGPQNPLEEQLQDRLRGAAETVSFDPLHRDNPDLTPMERRITATVACGLEADMTIEEICRLSGLNTANVRSYLKTIYGKWHVSHQPAFVAEARRRGLLDGS
ncbi:MAG: response regulator transcription factor [Streptosporangiaceae bacterium]|jgi:DNA-binding NarL/FixJ family response regulator